MECNKEEAVRAKELAESKMAKNDFESARKMVLKAQNLYPDLDNIAQMLSTCDVHCSAQKALSGCEKDWYEILQVKKFADEVTVKKQYRRLALILHPDKNRFPGADGAFKLICDANALLSDPAKKSLYDNKIRVSTKSTLPNQHINRSPQSHQQYGAQNNFYYGFGTMNQDQATQLRQGVFWTCCPFCKGRFQYLSKYKFKSLQCTKCLKAFIALEISVQGDSSGSKLGPQVPQRVPQKAAPSEKVVPKTANFKMGVQNAQGPSASQTGLESASGNMKTEETKNGNGNASSLHGGKEGMASDSDKIYGESEDVGNKTRKRGKKQVVELSSDCSDTDIEDPPTKQNVGNPDNLVRRSSRKRHNVIYEETDEDDYDEDKGKKQKGDASVDSVSSETDSDIDESSSEKLDTVEIDCPEAEFSDFEKVREESKFAVNQFWACYDDLDEMPRFYAKVKKVYTSPFKLLITWLEAKPIDPTYKEWINEDMPVGCGFFKLGKTEETDVRASFSHQICCEKGKRGSLVILPREGEVWSLFKDWDKSWSSDPDNHTSFKYGIVEVISDFVEGVGVKVCYLDKVPGFVSLFQRPSQHKINSFLIEPNEVYRFSHLVPCFKMTGTEREGVPIGSFELDSASLPLNPDDLFNSSLPKDDEETGKSVVSEGYNTPKKCVNSEDIKGKMAKLRRSPRGSFIIKQNDN